MTELLTVDTTTLLKDLKNDQTSSDIGFVERLVAIQQVYYLNAKRLSKLFQLPSWSSEGIWRAQSWHLCYAGVSACQNCLYNWDNQTLSEEDLKAFTEEINFYNRRLNNLYESFGQDPHDFQVTEKSLLEFKATSFKMK